MSKTNQATSEELSKKIINFEDYLDKVREVCYRLFIYTGLVHNIDRNEIKTIETDSYLSYEHESKINKYFLENKQSLKNYLEIIVTQKSICDIADSFKIMLGLVYELFSKINLFPIFKDIKKPHKKFDELGLDDQIKFFADNGFDFETHEAQRQDMDCIKSLNKIRNRIVHDGNIAKKKVKIHWYGAPELRFIYGMRGEEKLFWDKKSVIDTWELREKSDNNELFYNEELIEIDEMGRRRFKETKLINKEKSFEIGDLINLDAHDLQEIINQILNRTIINFGVSAKEFFEKKVRK